MSTESTTAVRFDGVGRYHTEIKVLVHSHMHAEPLDISQDVMAANTHKSVKSEGKANLTLTGSRNYLSLIYPNDYINIYFNIGDGNGWVRNFFGFIDRVQESYKVSDAGTPVNTYTIACTDFQKAIDKTQIYTNPQILGRRDTVSQAFATPNIGGVVLMGNGVRAFGSPADLVLNFLYIFMGFASQYLLPECYNPLFLERYREQRREYLLRSVAPRIREVIEGEGGFEAFLQSVEDAAAEATLSIDDGEGELRSPEEVNAAFRSRTRALLEERLGGLDRMGQVVAAYHTTAADAPATLLDIVDTTTFVEREAIDGWTFSETIWQQQGSVWSLLTAQSNEMVNEMFFDLRPTTQGLVNADDYARTSDEIGGNISGEGPDGPHYVPALIMREYPFSTINYIDASTIPTGLRNAAGEDEFFGTMYLGAIFSSEPNRAGRHVIEIPNLSVDDRINGRAAGAGFKHLDVIVIDQDEVIESDLGRSDHDHFNLIEALSTDIIGQQASYIMSQEMPIISPIHIIRHGLRTRRLETKFARFDRHSVQSLRGASNAVRNTPVEEERPESSTLGVHPDSSDMRTEPNWRLLDALWRAYEPYGCTGMNEYVIARTIASEYGVDESFIVASGAAALSEHQHAVAWAAKNIAQTGYLAGGGRRGEGQRQPYRNRTSSTTNVAEAIMPTGVPGRNSSPLASGPRNRPQSTQFFPGDKDSIGLDYNVPVMRALIESGGLADHLRRYFATHSGQEERVRAYFEVARNVINGTIPDPASSRGMGGSITFYHSAYANLLDDPVWETTVEERQAKLNRYERRFAHYVIEPVGASTRYSHIFARREIAPTSAEPASEPADTGSESTRARSTSSVDNSSARAQLFRWGLMHDHWYQHNLEYLSGSLMTRGNPSIRPGYRLDIRDRNLSFYVEAAGQQFHYPNKLTTTLEVSRGQPNNPYPVYVLPNTEGFDPTPDQRGVGSRLDKYFAIQDTPSTQKAIVFRNTEFVPYNQSPRLNVVDAQAVLESERVLAANYMDINNVLALQAADLDAQLAELNAMLDTEAGTNGGGGVDGAVTESGLTAQQLADRRELEIL